MRHVFWLVPGRLAGRPGPNREPWEPSALRALGIDVVLSLNDAEACDSDALAAHGIEHRCIALPPNEPPGPGDADVCRRGLPEAYALVAAQHTRGRTVLVHCSAGKDRTGMFMSYYLMREHGLGVDEAIARVREVQPRAMSAIGWEALARQVLAELGGAQR